MNQLSRQAHEAILALQNCHLTCSSMAMTHCLEMGGEHARPQHLRLMLDCAEFCAFTADALGRKSQFHNRFAALCADICETCAKDCEALGDMEECVQACRDCARHCTAIARLDHLEILEMASQVPPDAGRAAPSRGN
jgi:hypothetical protein